MDAFAGVLSQKIMTSLLGGKVVLRLHPIAFTSKQTSTMEEKYKPFLLKFAALKHSFDKFSDIINGYPVEVETDCQALRDVLMNDKLLATHARWCNSVLAHNIIDVWHVPGVTNIADGISRQYKNREGQWWQQWIHGQPRLGKEGRPNVRRLPHNPLTQKLLSTWMIQARTPLPECHWCTRGDKKQQKPMETEESTTLGTPLHDWRWQTMVHRRRNKSQSKVKAGMCHTGGGNSAGERGTRKKWTLASR